MTMTPELLILQQAYTLAYNHADVLQDALQELRQTPVQAPALAHLSKGSRRLLDQFAYRYTRLQDDMGNKLLPACLRALGEDVSSMAAIDRFNRLEQLGWLDSAEDWVQLRRIRNEFAHDYPDSVEERYVRLVLAMEAAYRLIAILQKLNGHITQQFPSSGI